MKLDRRIKSTLFLQWQSSTLETYESEIARLEGIERYKQIEIEEILNPILSRWLSGKPVGGLTHDIIIEPDESLDET